MRLIDADALNVRSYCRWFDDPDDVRVVERMIREAPTIASPPNDPLTLEDLREMDGEPVWISYFAGGPNVCMLVDAKHDVCRDAHGVFAVFENLGRTWIAYRRKPEEGTET